MLPFHEITLFPSSISLIQPMEALNTFSTPSGVEAGREEVTKRVAWMRMMGAESVAYHRSTVLGRADDHPGQALAYYASRGETPMRWGGAGRGAGPVRRGHPGVL